MSALGQERLDQLQTSSVTHPARAAAAAGGEERKRASEADAAAAGALPVADKLRRIARCGMQRGYPTERGVRVGALVEQKHGERVLSGERRVGQGVDAVGPGFVNGQTRGEEHLGDADI